MTEKYLKIIELLKQEYPNEWKVKAVEYMDQQLLFYCQYSNLAKIEIQYEFYINRKNKDFLKRFKDVCIDYPDALNAQCNDKDILNYIYKRYILEFKVLRKEVANA